MTTYNTGNPIGSTAVKDLYDNAENLDTLVNDRTQESHPDRLGQQRKTWHGMEAEFNADQLYRENEFIASQEDKQNRFNNFIASSGYQFLGDYAAGVEITEYNQILRDADGEFWRLSGQVELPYTTTGDWSTEGDLFVSVGDAALRQELANPVIGAGMVGFQQEGVGAVSRTVSDKIEEVLSVADFLTESDWLDIKSGVESLSVREAVKKAVDRLNEVGGTLHFPEGHYNIPYLPHTEESNFIKITKSGVKLSATSGGVVLENFLFYVEGEYGTPQLVGTTGFTSGDLQVNTSSTHGLDSGDYVQLLSGINAYTPDGGDWQLGSQNPTNLATPLCRYSEIHRVYKVDSPTTATLYSRVIYPDYRNNTSGQSYPLPDVVGAEIRKLTPVVGVTFSGLSFVNTSNNSFRCIVVRCASGITFDTCHFEAGSLQGSHVKTTDTLGLRFINCTSFRETLGFSGSSWNSFLVGGGSQDISFDGCRFVGEAQTVDITPLLFSEDIGYTGGSIRAEYSTAQNISIDQCEFINCGDGVTTHPGTYNFKVNDNLFKECAVGIRVRSRRNLISGNTFRTYRVGIALSAFHEDTNIVGNSLEQLPLTSPLNWSGISILSLSSEIMNNNDIRRVIISENKIHTTQVSTASAGVRIEHVGQGVPPNPEFTLFTDSIKTNLSNYMVKNNSFFGCSISINRWINGVTIVGNTFGSGSGYSHYIHCDNHSARHFISDNLILDDLAGAIRTGEVTMPSYPYNTSHYIGYQYSITIPSSELTNSRGMRLYGGDKPLFDSLKVSNGSGLGADRAAGAATLSLDAIPEDGESESVVRIFHKTATTGSKTLNVGGLIQPRDDGTYSIGTPAYRWSQIFAETGTINTSDIREKQLQRSLSEAERDVAIQLKGLLKAFKWNSAVSRKGDKARWHFGVMAQEVASLFQEHGLDAHDYALFCYDEWDAVEEVKEPILDEHGNETGEFEVIQEAQPSGNRYGIRYDQLLAFIISAM